MGPIQPIPHKVVFIVYMDGCFCLPLSASLMAISHSLIKAIKFSCSNSSECTGNLLYRLLILHHKLSYGCFSNVHHESASLLPHIFLHPNVNLSGTALQSGWKWKWAKISMSMDIGRENYCIFTIVGLTIIAEMSARHF